MFRQEVLLREVQRLEVCLADFAITVLVTIFDSRLCLVISQRQAEVGEEALDVRSSRRVTTLRDEFPGFVGFVVQVLVVDVFELLQEGREVNPSGLTCIGNSDKLSDLLGRSAESEVSECLLELFGLNRTTLIVIEKCKSLFELLDLVLRQVTHNVRHFGEGGVLVCYRSTET